MLHSFWIKLVIRYSEYADDWAELVVTVEWDWKNLSKIRDLLPLEIKNVWQAVNQVRTMLSITTSIKKKNQESLQKNVKEEMC